MISGVHGGVYTPVSHPLWVTIFRSNGNKSKMKLWNSKWVLYFRRILCLIYSSGRHFLELKGRIRNAASLLYWQFLPWGRGMVSCAFRGLVLLSPLLPSQLSDKSRILGPSSWPSLYVHTRSLWRTRAQKSYVSPGTCRLAKILFFSIPTEEELRSSNESTGQHHFY